MVVVLLNDLGLTTRHSRDRELVVKFTNFSGFFSFFAAYVIAMTLPLPMLTKLCAAGRCSGCCRRSEKSHDGRFAAREMMNEY